MIGEELRNYINEMIGPEGFYIEALQSSTLIDAGTKYLYLKRIQDSDEALYYRYLDILFETAIDPSKSSCEIITILKLLHQFYWNSELKFDVYGIRQTYLHFFSHFSKEEDYFEIQNYIRSLIDAHIVKYDTDFLDIREQEECRLQRELRIIPQIEWRKRDDMPSVFTNLSVEDLSFHFRVPLSQLLTIRPSQKNIITNHLTGLIKAFRGEYLNFQDLRFVSKKTAIRYQRFFDEIIGIHLTFDMPLTLILGADHYKFLDMINHADTLIELHQALGMSLEQYLNLSERNRHKFKSNLETIKSLISKWPLKKILEINQDLQDELLTNIKKISSLIKDTAITFDQFFSILPKYRQLIYRKADDLNLLFSQTAFRFHDLLRMDDHRRFNFIVSKSYPLAIMSLRTRIGIEELVAHCFSTNNLLLLDDTWINLCLLLEYTDVNLASVKYLHPDDFKQIINFAQSIPDIIEQNNLDSLFFKGISFEYIKLLSRMHFENPNQFTTQSTELDPLLKRIQDSRKQSEYIPVVAPQLFMSRTYADAVKSSTKKTIAFCK